MTIQHKETLVLSEPIRLGDVEQFVEMAKAKGHKADEQLSAHIFHPNGSGYKIELRLGDKW